MFKPLNFYHCAGQLNATLFIQHCAAVFAIRKSNMSYKSGTEQLLTDLRRATPFALFVLWLTTFPMAGHLLDDKETMDYFLWSHVFGLLLCTHRLVVRQFHQIFIGATVLTAAATLAYAFYGGGYGTAILLVLGIAASPLLVQSLLLLESTSRSPVLFGAFCIAVGNIGMLALKQLPVANPIKLVLLSVALLFVLTVPFRPQMPRAMQGSASYRHLPFIYLFQITSGFMYGLLLPVYYREAYLQGSEIFVYAVAAIVAAKYLNQRREAMLVGCILFATLAYAMLQIPSPTLASNASVWLIMAAVGIVDIAVIAYALSFQNQPRAIAYCFATMLAGIGTGSLLDQWISANALSTAALSALVFSAIALLFAKNKQQMHENIDLPETSSYPAPAGHLAPVELHASAEAPSVISPAVEPTPLEMPKPTFSAQEWRVLQAVAQYPTYREAATALDLSESSVKTYMQRMYKKTGTFRRKQLLEVVQSIFGAIPPL